MKLIKPILLAHLALALLLVGAFAAQILWEATHHRYVDPATGFYYASVDAKFDSVTEDEAYHFAFRGRSAPRWHWRYTTNFLYDVLELEWQKFAAHDIDDASGRATLHLDSLNLEGTENGLFTQNFLASSLLGTTNAPQDALQRVATLYNFVLAARDGSLPAPQHHGRHYKQPIRGSIYHFRLGIGIGSYVYVWVYIWTIGVFVCAVRQCKKRARPDRGESDFPHSE